MTHHLWLLQIEDWVKQNDKGANLLNNDSLLACFQFSLQLFADTSYIVWLKPDTRTVAIHEPRLDLLESADIKYRFSKMQYVDELPSWRIYI